MLIKSLLKPVHYLTIKISDLQRISMMLTTLNAVKITNNLNLLTTVTACSKSRILRSKRVNLAIEECLIIRLLNSNALIVLVSCLGSRRHSEKNRKTAKII